MIRDITIGQYYPSDSVLHRLDPRVKLFATMIYVISLFLDKSVIALGTAAIILGLVIVVSKVPLSYIVRGLKPILFLLLFSCVLNMFFTRGETVWWQWKFLTLSEEGLFMEYAMVIRYTGICSMTCFERAGFFISTKSWKKGLARKIMQVLWGQGLCFW